MRNDITLEQIEELQLPQIETVTKRARKYREVYLHFYNDEGEFYVGGYNPETKEAFGFDVTFDNNFGFYGAWMRKELETLLTEKSSSGAFYAWNSNFVPSRASLVPKIQLCEENISKVRQTWQRN